MAEFVVKSKQYHNQIIKADSYDYNPILGGYEFKENGKSVALVFLPYVFAIINYENDAAEFHARHDWSQDTEEETDDVCIDCRNKEAEAVDDDLFGKVWAIIDMWHDEIDTEDQKPEVIQ